MRNIAKIVLAALPFVLLGAMIASELPEMRRYLRMKRM